jgi:hypothetical protein
MSRLLPGSGQIFVGETGSGINSFLLLSAVSLYAMNTGINYSFIDGVLVLSSWFYRYYTGGFTNANEMAVQKLESEKIRVYAEIIELIESNYNSN